MGLGEKFPWKDEHELYDWRLAPLGLTFDELAASGKPAMSTPVAMGQFVTPSGKVELASPVIAALGFDPLPNYVPPRDPAAEAAGAGAYPYATFAGYRDRNSYNTNLHQIESLRRRDPEPRFFLNPADAEPRTSPKASGASWPPATDRWNSWRTSTPRSRRARCASRTAGGSRKQSRVSRPGFPARTCTTTACSTPTTRGTSTRCRASPACANGVHARIVKMPRGAVVRDAASIR